MNRLAIKRPACQLRSKVLVCRRGGAVLAKNAFLRAI